MAQARPPAARQTLNQVAALYSHDPGQTGLIAGVAFFGLVVIGLWGLYGDLFLSNLVVVAVAEVMVVCYAGSLAFLAGRLVRSQDRWQVESALTLRELLSEGRDDAANPLTGAPFYARQLRLRLDEDIRRCREYGTSLTVVAVRLELPGRAPSRASFSQANFDMAQLASSHSHVLVAPTALGMFEYAFLLPNCDRRAARAVAAFVTSALRRYRCSFGFAVFPDDGEDGDTLLRRAVEECGMLQQPAA
jgi:hypothetical protein